MPSVRVARSERARSTRMPKSPAPVFQRLLYRTEADGLVLSAKSPLLTLKLAASFSPSKSNGRRVRRFTVPPRPPSIISAVWFLNTSTPAISSDGTSWKLRPRPPEAEKLSRPLSSERTWVRPRTCTPLPSAEKCSGSPTARKRSMVTPGMRDRVSVTLRSGSAPMSCAVTESTKVSASRLMSWARMTLARIPWTCSASSSTGALSSVVLLSAFSATACSWAWSTPTGRARAMPRARAERARWAGRRDTAPPRSGYFGITVPSQDTDFRIFEL